MVRYSSTRAASCSYYGAIPNEKKTKFVIFLSWIVIFYVTIQDKKITNHDINFLSFFRQKKKKIRDMSSWLDICLIKALRNPRCTNGIRRPV